MGTTDACRRRWAGMASLPRNSGRADLLRLLAATHGAHASEVLDEEPRYALQKGWNPPPAR